METVNQLEAGFWDLLEAFQTVSVELGRSREMSQVARAALKLVLDLTTSSVAFIGLSDESGNYTQVFSLTADPAEVVGPDEVERIVASVTAPSPVPNTIETGWTSSTDPGPRAIHGLVIDNGRGFVVSERDHLPGHLGLLALNERSLRAGGWTKVEFWMPIA